MHANFFMVPNRIFKFGLNAREIVVYCCLIMHSDNESGTCFPSRKLITHECGNLSLGIVDKEIKTLCEYGFLKVKHQHRPKYITFNYSDGDLTYKCRDNKLFDEWLLKNNLKAYFAQGGCSSELAYE